MSENLLHIEKNLESESSTLSQEIPESNLSLKKQKELENLIPFTKKWRVKLYILNENGKWDDRGIGQVFCANEVEEESKLDGGKQNFAQMTKKLIMLKEKTNEIIFNIDIIKENADFHNQRGSILTWKKAGTFGEDNVAISFQEKEGILEILKNIEIVKGNNFSEEELLKEDQNDFNLEVDIENLPNLVRELGINMNEQKLSDFILCLNETNFEFIKKLGKLLNDEEKKVEELKSSVSFSSLETNISLNMKKDSKNENIKEVTEKNINNDTNKKIINKAYFNENINYIFNIIKNLILIGDKDLLELLFDDECYLITFGALEHDPQTNKNVPHRKYFKEIVKFKNPLNIKEPCLLKKINQNLRLTYLRDTAFGRLMEENTNRTINNIIQMNNNDIIQFFINNKEYLDKIFEQLKSDDILIKKEFILFLSELISCSKTVIQSRVTFNEILCQNGILSILEELIEDNPKNIQNDKNKEIKELININAVEIFISILSAVPLLIIKYLIENEGKMMNKLTYLLLYHNNFGVKYEVSQIFKTLIENNGEPCDKKLFFNFSLDKFKNYLMNSYSFTPENKNDISSTIQIIIEIFIAWINNMGFDCQFWLEKYQINSILIKLLNENNKIVNLYAIKLLKIILENSEHYICIKILSNDLCKILINLFKDNLKKNNIISSCLMNFFDSISQNDIYILNIIMNNSSQFFYENKEYFKNIILRYERKTTPKRKLLKFLNINTISEESFKEIEPLFHCETDNSKENEIEDNFNFYYDTELKEEDKEDDSLYKNDDLFYVQNNLENGIEFLNKKRYPERVVDDNDNEDNDDLLCEVEPLNRRLNNYGNNYYKNINIYNNEKLKNKRHNDMGLKEINNDIYKNFEENEDIF